MVARSMFLFDTWSTAWGKIVPDNDIVDFISVVEQNGGPTLDNQ